MSLREALYLGAVWKRTIFSTEKKYLLKQSKFCFYVLVKEPKVLMLQGSLINVAVQLE